MKARDHNSDVCRRIREQLPAFLAGELRDQDGQAVARHLERCAECAAEAAIEPELRHRLDQGVTLDQAPAGLADRIRSATSQEARPKSGSRWRIALAAAAVLAALINGALLYKAGILPHEFVLAELRIRAAVERIHNLLGVGLGDHLICAVYRRFAQDPPSEEQAVSEMGADWAPLADIAADYAPAGFQVRLAHRCEYGGREFIHVALFDGENLASLIVTERRPEDSFEGSAIEPALLLGDVAVFEGAADDFAVSAFETDSFLVYLVSDLTAADQAAAAAAFFPQISAFLAAGPLVN